MRKLLFPLFILLALLSLAALNVVPISVQEAAENSTRDAILTKTVELGNHHHNRERWFGISANQSGNDWAADTINEFTAISGSDVYGADASDEAKIFGTDDTPIIAGQTYFDFHQLLVHSVSVDTEYKLRIVYGTGTMANAITAGQYTETMVMFDSSNPQLSAGIPVPILMPRLAIDTTIWLQARNATDNATITFYAGAHGYDE